MSHVRPPGEIVREAGAEDLAAVARVRLEFLAAHRDVDVASFSEDFVGETVAFIRRHAALGTIRSWLAEVEGVLIGGVSMLVLDLAPRPEDVSGREGYIINMYVDPRHRRRGVGRQLLGECLESADDLRLRRLLLYSTDEGKRMYANAGFTTNPNWMEFTR